jgi:c-di-GMP-binding flagellar brake protein YcgR
MSNAPSPLTPPTINRRSSRRAAIARLARIECRKGSQGLGPNLAITTLDISETGARLVLKGKVDKGQELEVVLNSSGLPRPVKRLARTVWALPQNDGNALVGLRFDRALSYAEYQHLASLQR